MSDQDDTTCWISQSWSLFPGTSNTRWCICESSPSLYCGPTIHFFHSLLEDDEDLTWDQLKVELLENIFEQFRGLQELSVGDYIQ